VYPEEQRKVRPLRPTATLQADLVAHYTAPQPTYASLPRQLFPWQDIRLHVLSGVPEYPDTNVVETADGGGSSSGSGAVATGVEMPGGGGGTCLFLHGLCVFVRVCLPTPSIQSPTCAVGNSGEDDPSYLKFLYSTTFSVEGGGEGEGEEEEHEHEEEGSEWETPSPAPARARSIPAAAAAAASGSKRGRVEDGGKPVGKRGRGSVEGGGDGGVGGSGGMEDTRTPAEVEDAEVAAALADAVTPTWVAVFDTTTYALRRLVFNARALELFGWSQAEVDLRVAMGIVIRWLHPAHMLVRSVLAVNARHSEGDVAKYTYTGRYLRRSTAGGLPAAVLDTIFGSVRRLRSDISGEYRRSLLRLVSRELTRRSSLATPAPSMAAMPPGMRPHPVAVGKDGLPVASPTMLTFGSSPSMMIAGSGGSVASSASEAEALVAAFDELDSACVYTAFNALETVTNTYDARGVTHIVTTRFTQIGLPRSLLTSLMGTAAAAAASAGSDDEATAVARSGSGGSSSSSAADSEGSDDTEEVVRPQQFDVSEARPVLEEDVGYMLDAVAEGEAWLAETAVAAPVATVPPHLPTPMWAPPVANSPVSRGGSAASAALHRGGGGGSSNNGGSSASGRRGTARGRPSALSAAAHDEDTLSAAAVLVGSLPAVSGGSGGRLGTGATATSGTHRAPTLPTFAGTTLPAERTFTANLILMQSGGAVEGGGGGSSGSATAAAPLLGSRVPPVLPIVAPLPGLSTTTGAHLTGAPGLMTSGYVTGGMGLATTGGNSMLPSGLGLGVTTGPVLTTGDFRHSAGRLATDSSVRSSDILILSDGPHTADPFALAAPRGRRAAQ